MYVRTHALCTHTRGSADITLTDTMAMTTHRTTVAAAFISFIFLFLFIVFIST